MAGFKRSVVIERPIDEVFDFACDTANVSLFMPNVTKIEMLTEGGMKVGAKFRETRLMNGKPHAAVIEVVQHQRPEIHAAKSAMMGMWGMYTFRFFPEGPGTRVEMEAQVGGNFLWWLFLGMIVRMMEKEDGEYLDRLKTAMQSRPTNS